MISLSQYRFHCPWTASPFQWPRLTVILFASLAFVHATGAKANPQIDPDHPIRANLFVRSEPGSRGKAVVVGAYMTMDPGWHVYWKYPGPQGRGTTFNIDPSRGLHVGPIAWPTPRKFKQPTGEMGYGYTGDVLLQRSLRWGKPPLTPEKTKKIMVSVTWMACKEVCLTGEVKEPLSALLAKQTNDKNSPQLAKWKNRLPKAPLPHPDVRLFETNGFFDVKSNEGNFRIIIKWKHALPKDVEWIPDLGNLWTLDSESVKAEGHQQTTIRIQPKLIRGKSIKEPILESVLAYTDPQGRKRGLKIPIILW